ncbi:MAG: gamma-glutamylcyclotransferase family protein [Enterobacteriaceae bacterium]
MRIIVYGTLRREQGNSRWMTNATWLGDHILQGYELYDLGHYPAAIRGQGNIYCEVYRINAPILAELDELKSNSKEYKRELIDTPYGSAWIYLYQLPLEEEQKIPSGDWLKRSQG